MWKTLPMSNIRNLARQYAEYIMNPCKPNPRHAITRKELKELYTAQLFTQLVISGLSCSNAAEKAKEAAKQLDNSDLPFPDITVG